MLWEANTYTHSLHTMPMEPARLKGTASLPGSARVPRRMQGWSRLPSALQGCTHGTALCQAAAPISCRQTSPQVSLILGTYSKLWDIAHIFSQLHVTAHLERSEGIWLCRARGLQESGVFFCFQDGLGEELVGKQLLEAWWHKEPWKSALQKAEVVRSIAGRCSGML